MKETYVADAGQKRNGSVPNIIVNAFVASKWRPGWEALLIASANNPDIFKASAIKKQASWPMERHWRIRPATRRSDFIIC
jgi:hypothetical protein